MVAMCSAASMLPAASEETATFPDLRPGGSPPRSLWERNALSGDAGGVRPWLEDRGVTVRLAYLAEGFWQLHGGSQRQHKPEYRGDGGLFVEVDTAPAGLWENGSFFMHVQGGHGNGITDPYAGDFQVLSNIDADDFLQISELWYRHGFFYDQLWIKVGKQEANEDFAAVEYGGEFINSSAGFSPTIPLATFPDQDWGVVVGLLPWDWLSVNAGAYQGRADGGRSVCQTVDSLYGPMIIVEPAVHYSVLEQLGHVRVGGWFNGDSVDRLDAGNPDPGTLPESYGWYLTWDQELWHEHPEEADDEQGLGMFAQYGYTPEDRSEAEHYIGGGLRWLGPVPARDADVLGAGVFHVEFSDEAGLAKDGETAVEVFYRAQVTRWFSVKPDFQYIFNPGGTRNDDAVVVGARAEVFF